MAQVGLCVRVSIEPPSISIPSSRHLMMCSVMMAAAALLLISCGGGSDNSSPSGPSQSDFRNHLYGASNHEVSYVAEWNASSEFSHQHQLFQATGIDSTGFQLALFKVSCFQLDQQETACLQSWPRRFAATFGSIRAGIPEKSDGCRFRLADYLDAYDWNKSNRSNRKILGQGLRIP